MKKYQQLSTDEVLKSDVSIAAEQILELYKSNDFAERAILSLHCDYTVNISYQDSVSAMEEGKIIAEVKRPRGIVVKPSDDRLAQSKLLEAANEARKMNNISGKITIFGGKVIDQAGEIVSHIGSSAQCRMM